MNPNVNFNGRTGNATFCVERPRAKPQAVFINKESAHTSIRFLWGLQHPLVNKNQRLSCKDYYCEYPASPAEQKC